MSKDLLYLPTLHVVLISCRLGAFYHSSLASTLTVPVLTIVVAAALLAVRIVIAFLLLLTVFISAVPPNALLDFIHIHLTVAFCPTLPALWKEKDQEIETASKVAIAVSPTPCPRASEYLQTPTSGIVMKLFLSQSCLPFCQPKHQHSISAFLLWYLLCSLHSFLLFPIVFPFFPL
jgi:hypothetical protein